MQFSLPHPPWSWFLPVGPSAMSSQRQSCLHREVLHMSEVSCSVSLEILSFLAPHLISNVFRAFPTLVTLFCLSMSILRRECHRKTPSGYSWTLFIQNIHICQYNISFRGHITFLCWLQIQRTPLPPPKVVPVSCYWHGWFSPTCFFEFKCRSLQLSDSNQTC